MCWRRLPTLAARIVFSQGEGGNAATIYIYEMRAIQTLSTSRSVPSKFTFLRCIEFFRAWEREYDYKRSSSTRPKPKSKCLSLDMTDEETVR